MLDRKKVIKAIEGCLNDDSFCNKCDYDGCVFRNGSCEKDLLADTLALLKEQEERGKGICKRICDFIRGSCSVDTEADKEYVCRVIQQIFNKGWR